MYRIRLTTGEQVAYRTVEELELAVRSGVLSPSAEVFHKAAGRWLPINVHPDYQAAVTGRHAAVHDEPPAPILAERPSVEAIPPCDVDIQTSEIHEPEWIAAPCSEATGVAEYDPALDPTPVHVGPVEVRRTRSLRPIVALGFGVAGLCLIGGVAHLTGPPVGRWLAEVRATAPERREGMDPLDSLPPAPTSRVYESVADEEPYPVPSPPLSRFVVPGTPEEPPEPSRVSRLTEGRNVAPTYVEAYAEARAEMDEAFDYVQFRRVFAPGRFLSPDSMRAARRMVAAAANIVRVYRGREVMLEQTYRPDDPGGRGSMRESFETAEDSRALLANVDSLFGLLVAQQGRFTYSGGSLRFNEPGTGRLYAELRRDILRTLSQWQDSPDLGRGATIPRLMLAVGAVTPPPIR